MPSLLYQIEVLPIRNILISKLAELSRFRTSAWNNIWLYRIQVLQWDDASHPAIIVAKG